MLLTLAEKKTDGLNVALTLVMEIHDVRPQSIYDTLSWSRHTKSSHFFKTKQHLHECVRMHTGIHRWVAPCPCMVSTCNFSLARSFLMRPFSTCPIHAQFNTHETCWRAMINTPVNSYITADSPAIERWITQNMHRYLLGRSLPFCFRERKNVMISHGLGLLSAAEPGGTTL